MYRQSVVAPPMSRRTAVSGQALEPQAELEFEPVKRPRGPARKLPPVELGPIIKSKIQPPALRASTLTRKRLIDKLTDATTRRLTLLIAEAGYGKTTLLADFAAQSGIRTLWYRLDPTDADVITWANHLIAAAREAEPDFGEATLRLMSQLQTGGPPSSAFYPSVLAELGRLEPRRTLLVLDDFQAVDGKPEAMEFVQRLLRDSPPWLNLVVSSRRRPSFELARIASTGELTEILTDDLRFSASEIRELFAGSYGVSLDDDVVVDLDDRTKGWAASLQLFYGSIRDKSPSAVRAFARSLSGAKSPIYDFLGQEVLNNLPDHLELFLLRSSLLDRITANKVAALFLDSPKNIAIDEATRWIAEADQLTLITATSPTADVYGLHPLLRDFLRRQLESTSSPADIARLHLEVAATVVATDPLTAARHYLEGGAEQDAMRCLGDSVLLTIGSGQWGVAANLVERITGAPASPTVAIIRARRFVEEARLEEAEDLLNEVQLRGAPADVRAAFRQTRLSLGWRSGNSDTLYETLSEISADPETPSSLRDIAGIYIDASSMVGQPAPLPSLAARLVTMARNQLAEGHSYHAAISLHNAAVASLNAGDYEAAVLLGEEAVTVFQDLPFFASAQLSTHSVLALAEFERGHDAAAEAHSTLALETGDAYADVPAELSFTSAVLGRRDKAAELLTMAHVLRRQGRTDLLADALTDTAEAFGLFASDVDHALNLLEPAPPDAPLDFGYTISRNAVLVQAMLLRGEFAKARLLLDDALNQSRDRQARRAETRLAILHALVHRDMVHLEAALTDARRVGQLAILELADVLVSEIEVLQPLPAQIADSMSLHSDRWLPLLRRQLESGPTASGRAAAAALDQFGSIEDIGLLRAYAKTYSKRGVVRNLGTSLARRVSPRLNVYDLGKVTLRIGSRTVALTSVRRKSAAVLMYLVTRPRYVANRDQVIDDLWPDADPSSGTNNLNQSLYFLRREIDPWYEDDISVDYLGFQGDLVWLEPDLVQADSVEFMRRTRTTTNVAEAALLLETYEGEFAPEFEYEDWAIGWRTRVHSTFLEVANSTIERCVDASDLSLAVEVATHALHVDPTASDIERRLIWLYGRLGLHSAARRQHDHLALVDQVDGLERMALDALLAGPLPDA